MTEHIVRPTANLSALLVALYRLKARAIAQGTWPGSQPVATSAASDEATHPASPLPAGVA